MPSKKKTAKKTPKANRLPKKGKAYASETRKTKPTPKAIEAIPQAATPPKPKEQVTIAAAKGRPMLSWVGKRPLRAVTSFPAQPVERFTAPDANKVPLADPAIWKDWPEKYPHGGLLFHGDNKEVLAHLLANGFRGKVQLIYIDPPFDSGADYVRRVNLRGLSGTTKLDGETYSLGEQIQYTDIWANDNYLQFMYERLILLKELLAEEGSIWLHCDWRKIHLLRVLLDEVFGAQNFVDEIVWKSQTPSGMKALAQQFSYCHETLLWYAKGAGRPFHKQYLPYTKDYIEKRFREEDSRGRFKDAELQDPSAETLQKLKAEARLIKTSGGKLRVKQYLKESPGILVDSVWVDIPAVNSQADERLDYPTQKPEPLLARVIQSTSNPGDLVLDCFSGTGTTAAVAQKLGCRWIGCDINKGAIQTTTKRLQSVIAEQVSSFNTADQQQELLADNKPKAAPPAQLGFSVYRVNDYDLAIQHNEAVNLACEHIGVTRTLSDSFFEGTLGQKLVKIIPFGHPLSLTDLADVRAKIESRPNDSRDVVVVCLGKELGVEPWLADWNRMRKQGNTPNKIEVIELRTDPKYGKFFAHKPAKARVKVSRGDGKLTIDVQDFISPTILERLQEQSGPLLAPKITDWRAMVDSVMIDPAYDGKVFNIALADVPERKQDLVQGRYELPAPKGKTVVAVKVTDMLGEEVLIQQEV